MGVSRPTNQPEGCLARPPRARRAPSWMPGGPPQCPSRLYDPPGVKTLEEEEFWSFATASWQKPTEKKKPSPTGRFRRGDHLPEWEIVAIVIIIVTGIIEIIINIIPTLAPSPSPSHLISQLQLVL